MIRKTAAVLAGKATGTLSRIRDRLDRYGELESIAKKIEKSLANAGAAAGTTRAILNADDPRVAEIGLGLPNQPLWFGLDDPSVAGKTLPHAADARTCPRCGASLIFDAVYVGHDGVYRCPNQDFARPKPDITATNLTIERFDTPTLDIQGTHIEMPRDGLYNAYNVLAAFAVACSVGLDAKYIAERLSTFKAAFGRQERIEFRGRHLILVLSKNPAGFNETVRTATDLAHGKNFIIGLNDRKADGTDVSWIWDVDFEHLHAAEKSGMARPDGRAERNSTRQDRRPQRRRRLLLRRRPGPRAGAHLRRPHRAQARPPRASNQRRRPDPRRLRRLPAARPLLPDRRRRAIQRHRPHRCQDRSRQEAFHRRRRGPDEHRRTGAEHPRRFREPQRPNLPRQHGHAPGQGPARQRQQRQRPHRGRHPERRHRHLPARQPAAEEPSPGRSPDQPGAQATGRRLAFAPR